MDLMADLAKTLISWGSDNSRAMPWRESHDPYALAVAEILLQKTKGEDVVLVWGELMRRFPHSLKLAQAKTEEIQEIVGHLGLKSQRSLRLKLMASKMVEKGFLSTGMPGLGQYGHSVVLLSTGIEPDRVPLDGNLARFLCRYFGLEYERGESRKKAEVRDHLNAILTTLKGPEEKLAVIYSVVDLGATICLARAPLCRNCPFEYTCAFPRAE